MNVLGSMPEKDSKHILENYGYGGNQIINEVELKRYQHRLENFKKTRGYKFDWDDYVALGIIYFNQDLPEKFIQILEEGLSIFKDFKILRNLTIGKICLASFNKISETEISIAKSYFLNSANIDKQELIFTVVTAELEYFGKKIKVKSNFEMNISINSDLECQITCVPFQINKKWEFVLAAGGAYFYEILDEFFTETQDGSISKEKDEFIRESISEEDYEYLIEKATPKQSNKKFDVSELEELRFPIGSR